MTDSAPTILLTHLQQLKLWQQQQQENLRNIQQDQFAQIKLEREKVKQLLDKHASGPTKSRETLKDVVKATNATNGIPNFSPAFQIRNNDTGNHDNNTPPAVEGKKGQKGPFPFLKKGEGISRFDGKTSRARTKNRPPNYKPAPKINPPESRVLVRKLKLLPNSRRKSHESIVFCENQNNSEGKCGKIEQDCLNTSREIFEKENEDLAEFEILEKVTRNCSFNSDSSLMHKLVNKGKLSSNLDLYEENGKNELQEEPEIYNLASNKAKPFFNTDGLRWKSTDIDDDNKSCSSVDSSESLTPIIKLANTEVVEMVGLKKYCDEMMERIAAGVTESLADEEEAEKWTKWKDLSSMDWSEDTPIDVELDNDIKKTNNQEETSIANEDDAIKMRLKELETEIGEFKKQNNALVKLRSQHEQLMKQLTKEHEAFKKQQNEAKEKFEGYMKDEKLKLMKQKHAFENYQKSKKEFPDKKEREEIAALKNEVQKLQEELKKQKSQLTAECGRLRAHASSIETERTRMKAEMQRLENDKKEILAAFKELQSKPPVVKRPVISKTFTDKVPLSKSKQSPKKLGVSSKKTISVSKNVKKVTESIKNKKELSNFEETMPKHVRFIEHTLETREVDSSLEEVGQMCVENEYQEIKHNDKVERVYFNGEREFLYNSGTRRLLSEDGSTETVYFYNGDVLLILPDKSEVYHFIESGIKQTKYLDGLTLVEFPDGQEERVQKDGTKEVSFKDGSIHLFYPDGTQEIKSVEGSVLKIYSDGSEVLELKNGEKEIHTKDFKRREFPDGTVKIAHSDGKVETRFPNGRIRIKDKDNNIIVDTKYIL